VLGEPLSFWGGIEPTTGRVVDRRHPQCGETITAAVLVMPSGRGSSSAASVLAESIRCGTAPRAIVLAEADEILLVGALVANELYGRLCPIVVVDPQCHAALRDGHRIEVGRDGRVVVRPHDEGEDGG
jgi:predicted aconitase with swiveling domain